MMIIIIFVLAFFVIVCAIYYLILTKKNTKKYSIPKKVRNTYKEILVSTNKIVVLCNEYYEEENTDITPSGYFPFLPNDHENIPRTLKYVSILTYDDFLYNGKKYSFESIPIDMSVMELKEIFRKEENIAIYYDDSDLSDYYFDLSKIVKS